MTNFITRPGVILVEVISRATTTRLIAGNRLECEPLSADLNFLVALNTHTVGLTNAVPQGQDLEDASHVKRSSGRET